MHQAVGKGDKDLILVLLGKGANINAKDSSGLTPLDTAFHLNDITTLRDKNIIDFLIEKGASLDIDAKDRQGRTKLDRAFQKRDAHTAELLLKKGASIDAGADKK